MASPQSADPTIMTGGTVIVPLTDPGRKRKNEPNQDSILIAPGAPERNLPPLMIMADGMGGYVGGAVASQTVVQAVFDKYQQADPAVEFQIILHDCMLAAYTALKARAADEPALVSMGSTAVLAVIHDGKVTVANVGDSRGYLLHCRTIGTAAETEQPKKRRMNFFSRIFRRKQKPVESQLVLEQLTYDHSVVADQVRAGQLTPLQARRSRKRNRLTQSISPKRPIVQPYLFQTTIEDGDVLILCTDGLWGVVPEAILQVIVADLPPQEAAARLIELANANGGPDNISVIIAGPAIPAHQTTLDEDTNPGL